MFLAFTQISIDTPPDRLSWHLQKSFKSYGDLLLNYDSLNMYAYIRLPSLLSIVLLADWNSATAQNISPSNHSAHIHTNGTAVSTTPVIDGSVHPELITDQEAITVFWISIMEPSGADQTAQNRFAAKTGKMKLSASDRALLWAAAQDFYRDFMPYRDRAQQLADASVGLRASTDKPTAVAQQRATVAASIDQLATSAHQGMLTKLSPSAAAAFKANLADVKAHMKIVPPPHM